MEYKWIYAWQRSTKPTDLHAATLQSNQFGYNAPELKGREKPRGVEAADRLYGLLADGTVSVRILKKADC